MVRTGRSPGVHLLVVILLIVGIAGCVGTDDDPQATGPGTHAPRPDATESMVSLPDNGPPTWSLRDYWTYENTGGTIVTFVVTEETATDWIVDTTDDQYAFFDHALDDSSSMGPQRKSDLAGSEGSDRVVFFQWPLTDGASWTTMWDGEQRTVRASALDDAGVFLMEAHSADGTLYASYEYDPADGWFRTFDFYNPDGTLQFGHVLVDRGHDWTGEVVRYTAERVAFFHHMSDPGAPPVVAETAEFVVGAGQEVFLLGGVFCTAGIFRFQVFPQDAPDEGHTTQIAPCPDAGSFFGIAGTTPGPWRLSLAFAGTPGDASWVAQAFVRTRMPIAVG